MVLQRRLIELREVPQRDRHRKQRAGDERTCGPAREPEHPPWPHQRPDHPRGRPVEQQRREYQREDEVLHHVRAEEVGVREVVQRAVERQTQYNQRPGERRDPSTWCVEPLPKHIEPAQEDEPDDHARMQVPVLPGPRGWRRQRHPAPAAPPPLSVSAPKKRNSSATITPSASSSGAPNRNVKNVLSAFKCM